MYSRLPNFGFQVYQVYLVYNVNIYFCFHTLVFHKVRHYKLTMDYLISYYKPISNWNKSDRHHFSLIRRTETRVPEGGWSPKCLWWSFNGNLLDDHKGHSAIYEFYLCWKYQINNRSNRDQINFWAKRGQCCSLANEKLKCPK